MKKILGISVAILIGITSLSTFARPADDDDMLDFTGFEVTSSSSLWKDQYRDPLVMPKTIKRTGEKIFIFSPKARQWAAYNSSGALMGYGRANGGGDYCAELGESCRTEGGKFQVYRKGDADCISHTFPMPNGGAQMPFCMFFSGGSAIHGSPQLSMMNGSHGCVRVTTPSADWLSHNFMEVGTKVLILSY
jgi:hypothetical protein